MSSTSLAYSNYYRSLSKKLMASTMPYPYCDWYHRISWWVHLFSQGIITGSFNFVELHLCEGHACSCSFLISDKKVWISSTCMGPHLSVASALLLGSIQNCSKDKNNIEFYAWERNFRGDLVIIRILLSMFLMHFVCNLVCILHFVTVNFQNLLCSIMHLFNHFFFSVPKKKSFC